MTRGTLLLAGVLVWALGMPSASVSWAQSRPEAGPSKRRSPKPEAGPSKRRSSKPKAGPSKRRSSKPKAGPSKRRSARPRAGQSTGAARQKSAQPGHKSAQSEDERREDAERFFRAGEQAYNSGQYLAAAQAFEQAFALLPLPAIAFSTAQAYRLQYFIDKDASHLVQAIELYRRYIASVDRGGRRDDAAASLAELEIIRDRLQREGKLRVVRRDALSAKTQIMVTTPQIQGATASVDGRTGETPFILEVEPGEHRVEVESGGYFPVTQQALAVEGRLVVVEVALEPRPARMIFSAEAGATISVDGRPVGTTPQARPVEVPAGKHFVAVTRRGRHPWARELELERGQTIELRTRLETTSQRQASYWVMGAAGLSLVAAGGVGVLAYQTDQDLAVLEEKRQTDSLTSDEFEEYLRLEARRGDQLRLVYVLVGAGVLTAAAGGLLYWFDMPRISATGVSEGSTRAAVRGAPSLRVTPVVGTGRAGFAVAGHF